MELTCCTASTELFIFSLCFGQTASTSRVNAILFDQRLGSEEEAELIEYAMDEELILSEIMFQLLLDGCIWSNLPCLFDALNKELLN